MRGEKKKKSWWVWVVGWVFLEGGWRKGVWQKKYLALEMLVKGGVVR